MGWKSVDLQVAIPRTLDASNLQDQMSKQHQRFQDSLAQHQLKEQLNKRKQVNEYEQIEQRVNEKDKHSANNNYLNKKEPPERNTEEQEHLEHPYLGNRFDLTR